MNRITLRVSHLAITTTALAVLIIGVCWSPPAPPTGRNGEVRQGTNRADIGNSADAAGAQQQPLSNQPVAIGSLPPRDIDVRRDRLDYMTFCLGVGLFAAAIWQLVLLKKTVK